MSATPAAWRDTRGKETYGRNWRRIGRAPGMRAGLAIVDEPRRPRRWAHQGAVAGAAPRLHGRPPPLPPPLAGLGSPPRHLPRAPWRCGRAGVGRRGGDGWPPARRLSTRGAAAVVSMEAEWGGRQRGGGGGKEGIAVSAR